MLFSSWYVATLNSLQFYKSLRYKQSTQWSNSQHMTNLQSIIKVVDFVKFFYKCAAGTHFTISHETEDLVVISFFDTSTCRKLNVKQSSPILNNECSAWSWSRFLGSQPTGDLVINPVIGCRYFPPDLRLLCQPERSPPWLVPNYTAWWQRHTGVSSLPKAMELSQDSNSWPVNCKSIALPIVKLCHL